jgi:hypothetical protein
LTVEDFATQPFRQVLELFIEVWSHCNEHSINCAISCETRWFISSGRPN